MPGTTLPNNSTCHGVYVNPDGIFNTSDTYIRYMIYAPVLRMYGIFTVQEFFLIPLVAVFRE